MKSKWEYSFLLSDIPAPLTIAIASKSTPFLDFSKVKKSLFISDSVVQESLTALLFDWPLKEVSSIGSPPTPVTFKV